MRTLVKYSPLSHDVLGNFDRIFDSFFNDSVSTKTVSPRVDVQETENSYILEAELPGMNEKDLEVKIDDSLLTISSKQEEEKEEKRNGYILKERSHSSFARSFVLPENADRDSIEANFSNGLLSLTIGKKPEAQPKRIEVKSKAK